MGKDNGIGPKAYADQVGMRYSTIGLELYEGIPKIQQSTATNLQKYSQRENEHHDSEQ